MAGLIKGQILKHLSKFAKNLNSESVNVSTLRGEGELRNLELNEEVLTDLLELPTWLRLTHASVNKVSVKIQWTKLKSVPIHLSLDEVVVAIETCETLRPQSTSNGSASSLASGSHYGFSDKVIDGLTVTINSVHVTFKSAVFTAAFQVSRVLLDSRSPGWQRVVDLRMTRLKDPERNMLLLFKELSWQSLRIEAKSTDVEQQQLAPLRLITNACHCRITIKKKLQDCSVVGCRLVVLLDDLLWVLTDSQLITACHFAHSLTDLVKQATQQSHKVKAVRKLESLPDFYGQQQQQQQQSAPAASTKASAAAAASMNVFSKFDVIETSYHFVCEQIDLHLCDDPGSGRSSHPLLSSGASLQLSVTHFRVDYYPYHLAGGDRTHWVRYGDCGPQQLSQSALCHFRNLLIEALSGSRIPHAPLARAPPHAAQASPRSSTRGHTPPSSVHPPPSSAPSGVGGATNGSPSGPSSSTNPQTAQLRSVVHAQMRKLMASCCVVSLRDFTVFRVTTTKRKQPPKEFVASDKERLCLPTNTSSVHLEFINYYYPGDCDFPVPPPAVYGSVCPVRVVLDLLSVVWLNAFGRALQLAVLPDPATNPPQYLDMHVQFVMPRVVLEATCEPLCGQQRDRPRGLQVQSSRVTLSNCRPPDPSAPGSLASLGTALERAQTGGELFFASAFPAHSDDCLPVATKFVRHAMGEDDIREIPKCAGISVYESMNLLHRESLWTQARDLLFLHCEPVWVEFTGTPTSKHRPLPFVDAFPLSIWIHLKMPGIKDGIPIVPGVLDAYSPVMGAPVPDFPIGSSSTGEQTPSSVEESVRTASARVKREKSTGKKEAGLNVLVHCHSLVSCQLNHYQYLFLMRQLDMLTELSAFLTCDSAAIYKTAGDKNSWIREIDDSLVISAMVPQVDVSFVIPPLHPTKDSMVGDMEGFVPDSSSTVGEVQEIDSLREMRASSSEHSINQRLHSGSNACGPNNSALQVDGGTVGGSDISKSQSDGQLATTGSNNQHITPNSVQMPSNVSSSKSKNSNPATPTVKSSQPPTPPSVNLISPSTVTTNVLSPNQGGNVPASSSIQDNFNHGFSSMRKGFSSLMTSIESSVKTSPEDMSDTISIQSDLSSDSDNFVLLNLEANPLGAGERSDSGLGMEAAFRADATRIMENSAIEVATEAFEETTPSEELSEITSSFRRKNNIAVVNFQVSGVQFIQEAHGYDSTIKLQARHLSASDCNAIPYDEFQSKFSSRVKGWSETFTQDQHSTFKVRLESKAVDEPLVSSVPSETASQDPTAGPTSSTAKATATAHTNGNVPQGAGGDGGVDTARATPSMFSSKGRVGSFSFKKSFDQFEDSDAVNLWKKCTSYSPKIKHMFPKWGRLSGEVVMETANAGVTSNGTATGATTEAGDGSAVATGGSCDVSSTSTAFDSSAAISYDDKRYSVSSLPVRVQPSLRAEVGELSLSLLLSSLTGLTELVQDELPPPPMDCSFVLRNIGLHITEDQGSSPISSSSVAVTRLLVPSLLVDRDALGTFVIRPPDDSDTAMHSSSTAPQSGLMEEKSMTRSSQELGRLTAEVTQLRQALHVSDANLRDTRDENSSLKEAIRLLKLDCEQLQQQQQNIAAFRGSSSAAVPVPPSPAGADCVPAWQP